MRVLVCLLMMAGFGASAESLYVYKIEVGTPKFSEGHMDRFTQAFARVLRETGNAERCIDLRRLYQFKEPPIVSAGKKLKVINVLMLLTRTPLEPFPVEELRAALCEGLDERCDLRGHVAEADVASLNVVRVSRVEAWDEPIRLKKEARPLPELKSFPRFSSSCESGKTDESIFFSARTAESREFLKAAGIPVERTVSVHLKQGNVLFWGLGAPDENWIEAPVNRQGGPLVPPGILDELQ